MTATERLRQLLDERGVEWEGEEANSILHDGKFLYTYWRKGMHCFTEPIGAKEGPLGVLTDFSASGFTPEQAVEATLGPAVPPPEPPDVPYDILIDELRDTWGIEASWDGLRKFWYLGWTDEHVEDMGRLHDELRDAIVELLGDRCDWVQTGVTHAHNVLDKASHAGRGTCKMTFVDLRGPAYTDVYECSECGHQTMVCTVMGKSEPPNYCPNCGRKVES